MFDLTYEQKDKVAHIMANTVREMVKVIGKDGQDGDVMDVMQLIMAQVTLAVLLAGLPLEAVLSEVMHCNKIAQSPEAKRALEMVQKMGIGGVKDTQVH